MKKGQIWITDTMITFFLMVLMLVSSTVILDQRAEAVSRKTRILSKQAEKITRSDELIYNPEELANYSEDQRRVIPQTIVEKEAENADLLELEEARESPVKGVRRLVFVGNEVKVLEVK